MRKYGRLQAFISPDLGDPGMEAAELVYLPFQLGILLIVDAFSRMNLVQLFQRPAGKLGIFPELPLQLGGERLKIYLALSQGFKYVLEISQNNDPVITVMLALF